jgi:hypothetical protein
MKRAMQMFGSSVLLSFAPLASPQEEQAPAALKIAAGFVSMAGSHDNSVALVRALHEGMAVNLVAPVELGRDFVPEIVVIEPPTGKMAWNDVKLALMLARDALRHNGIEYPTLLQLHASLLGGDITSRKGETVTLGGVLCMRANGMNWGAIAAERYRRAE